MAIPSTESKPDNASGNSDYDGWAKSKNGKFKVYVDAIHATSYTTYKAGKKTKVDIFGITNYDQDTDDSVLSKIISAFKDKFQPTILKLTSSQAEYINGLGDDPDYDSTSDDTDSITDDSTSTESSSSEDTDSATAYVDVQAFMNS